MPTSYLVIYDELLIGGSKGFIPNAALVYSTGKRAVPGGDYHGQMNGKIFRNYSGNKLVPNVPRPFWFILDNASCLNVQAPNHI